MNNTNSASKKKAQRDPITRAWDTLKSMKFAIILLLVITALTVVNLFANEFIVPTQGSDPGIAYSTYREAYGEPRATILTMLQMYSPYTSWWYSGLLGLLSLSLVVCVIDRSSLIWRLMTGRRYLVSEGRYTSYENNAVLSGDEQLAERVPVVLKKAGYNVSTKDTKSGTLLHARKQSIAHSGAWFVHVGFILLVVGGALIARGQYREMVSGLPGDMLAPSEEVWGFNVRVDDFRIEYYPLRDGQYVQVDGGQQIAQIEDIHADSTLALEILWPQRSFEPNVDPARVSNRIDRRMGGSRVDQANISDYIADLTVIDDGEEVMQTSIEVNAPLRYNGYRFYQSSFNDTRTDARGTWTTVIEVRKDSGSPFVWAGIIFVSLGLMLGLYLVPRDIFARIRTDENGESTIHIAGTTKGRNTTFGDQFQRLIERIESPEKD